jgi:hypothetical protein
MDCTHALRSVRRICTTLVLTVTGLLVTAGAAFGAEVLPGKGGPFEPNASASGWLELVAVLALVAVAIIVGSLVAYTYGRESVGVRRPVTGEGAAEVAGGFQDPKTA